MKHFLNLIAGILAGLLLGLYAPEWVARVLFTAKTVIGQLITFTIPLIILFFIMSGIASLPKNSGKLLGKTVALSYCSTILAGLFAFTVAMFGPFLTAYFARFERRKLFISILIMFGLANTVAALAPNIWVMSLARLVPAGGHGRRVREDRRLPGRAARGADHRRRPAARGDGACITPVVANIDVPSAGSTLDRRFGVGGWAVKDAVGVAKVEVLLDGRVVAEATYGGANEWLRSFLKHASRDPRMPNVQFTAQVDAGDVAAGRHWLGLRVTGGDGSVDVAMTGKDDDR